MVLLTAKQMHCAPVCVSGFSHGNKKNGRKKERKEKEKERERWRKCGQMSAFTLWEAQGCLPRTERQRRDRKRHRQTREARIR